MVIDFTRLIGPSRFEAARIFSATALFAVSMVPSVAHAGRVAPAAQVSQSGRLDARRPAAPPQQQVASVPQAVPADPATATRLVWWALTALDQANLTGNYSVLRDLGVPAFQERNTSASLAGVFQNLRDGSVDLGATLSATPTFQMPPVLQGNLMRARGVFALRPVPIGFDLLFQNVGGRWRIFGISVVPLIQKPAQNRSTR